MDADAKVVTLYGESDDFGECKIEALADCVQKGKVFQTSSLLGNWIEEFEFSFLYKDCCGEIIDLHTYN